MRIFQSASAVVLRDGDNYAVARCYGGEFVISCYRRGHKSGADAGMVEGGRLDAAARVSGGVRMLHTLLSVAREKWAGRELYCDAPDERRLRVYARLMDRHGVQYTVLAGAVLSFTF